MPVVVLVQALVVFSALFCEELSSLGGARQCSSFHLVCIWIFSHSSSSFFNMFSSPLSKSHQLIFPEPSCLLVLRFIAISLPTEVSFFRVAHTAPGVVHGNVPHTLLTPLTEDFCVLGDWELLIFEGPGGDLALFSPCL